MPPAPARFQSRHRTFHGTGPPHGAHDGRDRRGRDRGGGAISITLGGRHIHAMQPASHDVCESVNRSRGTSGSHARRVTSSAVPVSRRAESPPRREVKSVCVQ